mgnify:CR=1 FL=1
MKHLILLQSPFFTYVREGRCDLLADSLSEFKETATAICYKPDVIWHEIHFSLSCVEEELKALHETVTTEISRFTKQAISFIRRMIEHVRLMITNPPVKDNDENGALSALIASEELSKADVVQLGRAIHEAAYRNTSVKIYDVISRLAVIFSMEITENYANSCYTEIKYRSQKSYSDFIDRLRDVFLSKIERDMEKKKNNVSAR